MNVRRWQSSDCPDAEALKQKLQQQGYEPHQWKDSPGVVYRDYLHMLDEVVCIISGQAEFTVAGKTETVSAGDMIEVPAQTLHSLKVIGNEPLVYITALKRR